MSSGIFKVHHQQSSSRSSLINEATNSMSIHSSGILNKVALIDHQIEANKLLKELVVINKTVVDQQMVTNGLLEDLIGIFRQQSVDINESVSMVSGFIKKEDPVTKHQVETNALLKELIIPNKSVVKQQIMTNQLLKDLIDVLKPQSLGTSDDLV